jgi:hypothetical protein
MWENDIIESDQADESWKVKTIVIGGALGAMIGVAAAYLIVQRAQNREEHISFSVGKGVKLGVIIFTLLRQVAQLDD